MGEEEANPNSFYIASDLLTDIFMRLPLKSLVKFKTVSKEWRSILNSKRFVDMHLNFQKSEKSRRKILAACHCDCEPPPTPFPGDEEIVYLHCESTRPSMSCDGLVCIPEPGWVNVLNPSTGQFRRFPSGPDPVPTPLNFRRICFSSTGAWSSFFPGHWAMGFGRDKVTGSYKVVRMFFDPNNYEILDVNTGEWRKLSPPPYEVDTGRRSACVNGSIYWLDIWRGCCKLLVLDLHTEEFHDAPLGASMVFKMDTQIVNLEDRLATATGRLNSHHEWGLEIWTMDAKETWSKTYSISLASLCIKPLEARWYRPVIASKQGDVVICDNKKRLFRYYQRTDTICQISPRTCVISPYLENMVQLHNEQADLRTEFACIRGNTCIFKVGIAFQSRVDKFLSKGKCENPQNVIILKLKIYNIYD
ncbi:F-box/LRR-repeat protein [Cardamine amara subsp. amara]|uniref:F-box/LRR-repeat protein n=1 Tax=Cardamine amara subsp. amara TaxID=228776 RepID=A0ABD0ZUS5_CARAN